MKTFPLKMLHEIEVTENPVKFHSKPPNNVFRSTQEKFFSDKYNNLFEVIYCSFLLIFSNRTLYKYFFIKQTCPKQANNNILRQPIFILH